jgi:ABC-type branched-subunit amino acid transport system substrate-binding protein
MINSLTQAVQFGLRDKQANGKNFEIVVPLYSRLMAQGAGANIKGILGTTNWNWSLSDEGSQAFVKSFGQEYGFPPSQAARTCYVQTLLYANACETAGTFYPPEVIKTLGGFEFDGMGNGPTEYRIRKLTRLWEQVQENNRSSAFMRIMFLHGARNVRGRGVNRA